MITAGCIVRVDSPSRRTKGWQARVYTTPPRYVSRLFSDAKYGGQVQAYRAAQAALPRLARMASRARNAAVTGTQQREGP